MSSPGKFRGIKLKAFTWQLQLQSHQESYGDSCFWGLPRNIDKGTKKCTRWVIKAHFCNINSGVLNPAREYVLRNCQQVKPHQALPETLEEGFARVCSVTRHEAEITLLLVQERQLWRKRRSLIAPTQIKAGDGVDTSLSEIHPSSCNRLCCFIQLLHGLSGGSSS